MVCNKTVVPKDVLEKYINGLEKHENSWTGNMHIFKVFEQDLVAK